MATNTPKFYQPLFGNDNFYAPDVVDIASFMVPVTEAAQQSTLPEQIKAIHQK